jgi:serine/threonine protein kinase
MRIHHKNLVSLIGYCKEKNNLVLVLEYMSEGSLQDHLRGLKVCSVNPVWLFFYLNSKVIYKMRGNF